MNTIRTMNGQLDLFSLIGELENTPNVCINTNNSVTFQSFKKIVATMKEDDYLHREERILSLLRSKKTSAVTCTTVGEFMNIFSKSAVVNNSEKGMNYLAGYIFNKLMETVRVPIQKCIVEDDFKITETKLRHFKFFSLSDELNELIGENALGDYIRNLSASESGIGICSHYAASGNFKNIALVSNSGIFEKPQHYSLEKMKISMTGNERYYRSIGLSSSVRINDVAVIFTRAIMYNSIASYMANASDDDVVIQTVINKAKHSLSQFIQDNVLYIDGSAETRKVAEKFNFPYVPVKTDNSGQYAQNKYALTENWLMHELLSTGVYYNLLGLTPMNLENYVQRVPGSSNCTWFDERLTELYQLLLNIEYDNERIRIYEKAESSDYAKSYQTKKNIPDKVVKAMEESLFNESFGYVEFDADCDLDKVEELTYEWGAVNKILNQNLKEDVALRFRKLGNHNANGLYYSGLQCMCVDVRHPSSFVHEYFHMLDYTNDHLSGKYAFAAVREMYKKSLMQMIGKDNSLEIRLKKTKYNLDYYLIPTEIFARCAEIYLTRVIGIDNSLVKPDMMMTSFAYPDEQELLIVIKQYFDEFMEKYCSGEENLIKGEA